MAATDGFTQLSDFKAFKTTWKIKVKIVHTWKQYTTYTGETIVMILADFEVVSIGEMKTSELNDKPKKRLEVILRDTSDQRLSCTLWGKFADKMWTACHEANQGIVTCLIRCGKINTYNGDRTISYAFDMSLLLINADYPAVQDFVIQLPQDDLKITFGERNCDCLKSKHENDDYVNQFPRSIISDMLEATMEGKFKIYCSIYHIDMEFGCGETKIILFDNNAIKLVNQTAIDVLGGQYDEIQDPTIVPPALQALVGKTFLFLASVETSNIVGGKETYKVSYVEMGGVDNIEESDIQIDPRDVISNEVQDQTNSSGIETSVTTPSSKRKDESNDDATTQSSTSKKMCLPSINQAIEEEKEKIQGKKVTGP
ncbi:PREDICTED: uncharacterized protein LOC104728441 [Camelina sativa]|uniref:Uncharacterized protein LOC104728441 n=1 Tax=Camelina sativa TaxID=90675 RepID=A0ABM0UST5_CAMSA|nr:PREDICTED: uncharacterized protein LOC104728441 [Camelina sativa]